MGDIGLWIGWGGNYAIPHDVPEHSDFPVPSILYRRMKGQLRILCANALVQKPSVAERKTVARHHSSNRSECVPVRVSVVNFGLRPSRTPSAFARARPLFVLIRIKTGSNSARPSSTVNINRPYGVVVSAQTPASERNPAPLSAIVASKSRVDWASLSSRVTTRTSAASNSSMTRRSYRRLLSSPLATSRNTLPVPEALSAATCASTLWPSVESRA